MAGLTLKPMRPTSDLPMPISRQNPIVAMRPASAMHFPGSTTNIVLSAPWRLPMRRGSRPRCIATTSAAAGRNFRISISMATVDSIRFRLFSIAPMTIAKLLISYAGRTVRMARCGSATTIASIVVKEPSFLWNARSPSARRATISRSPSAITRMKKTDCKTRNSTPKLAETSSLSARPISASRPTGRRKRRPSHFTSRTGSRSVP